MRAILRRHADADDGITLVEVVVAMTIMSIFMALFSTSMVSLFRNMNATERGAQAQAQMTTAFQRLDRELRYAEGISLEGSDGDGGWVVEYVWNDRGTIRCTQLRLDKSGALRWRNWVQAQSTPSPNPRSGAVLATGITVPPPTTLPPSRPFNFVQSGDDSDPGPAESVSNFQRLRVNLTAATYWSGSAWLYKETNVLFTALNTTANNKENDPFATVCTEGRAVSW
jgi:prepilin-type N-terminal cleavage/methylation domain-containing protein